MHAHRAGVGLLAVFMTVSACADSTLAPDVTTAMNAALVRTGTSMLNLVLPDSSLVVGDTVTLTVQSRDPRRLRSLGLSYRSTDTSVARVSSQGHIRAQAVGTTRIIARAGSFADTLPLVVGAAGGPAPVPTDSVPAPPPPVGFGPRSFFVAPSGTAGATGRIEQPWSLAAALAQPSAIQPGDTIWLRAGTYRGDFVSRLAGTADRPVVVRQYPGERATVDGRLEITGANAWYWGFEVMYSDTRRVSAQQGSDPTDVPRENKTVFVTAPNVKLINLVVHDMGDGIFGGATATALEINGCIVYNNGWVGPERGHGHTIYLQNAGPAKRILDNVLFNSFGHGIHIYGSDAATLENFEIEGNTIFGSGAAAAPTHGLGANILAWGGAPGRLGNIRVANNSLFHHAMQGRAIQANANGNEPGYDLWFTGNTVQGEPQFNEWRNFVVTDNRISSGTDALGGQEMLMKLTIEGGQAYSSHVFDRNRYATPRGASGSVFYTWVTGTDGERATLAQWQARTGYDRASTITAAFTGQQVLVRPSRFEAGRAIVTVWNWDNAGMATIDAGATVPAGFVAQVHHVYDVFGAPVATIPAGSRSAAVALGSMTPPMPVGRSTRPASTGTGFNVFLVRLVPAAL